MRYLVANLCIRLNFYSFFPIGIVTQLKRAQNYDLNVTTSEGNVPSFVKFSGKKKDEKGEFLESTQFPLKRYNVIFMEFANKLNSTQVQENITKTYKIDIITVQWNKTEISLSIVVFLFSLFIVLGKSNF